MSDRKHAGDLPSRLLDSIATRMHNALHTIFHRDRASYEAESEKRMEHYGRAYGGPAHRALDAVDRAVTGNAPSWREPPIPGLGPNQVEQEISKEARAYDAKTERKAEERAQRRPVFAAELAQAEKDTALRIAATENEHDQGRER